jgi:hypothetical protein
VTQNNSIAPAPRSHMHEHGGHNVNVCLLLATRHNLGTTTDMPSVDNIKILTCRNYKVTCLLFKKHRQALPSTTTSQGVGKPSNGARYVGSLHVGTLHKWRHKPSPSGIRPPSSMSGPSTSCPHLASRPPGKCFEHCAEALCRSTVQKHCAEALCRSTVQKHCAEALCRSTVQKHCASPVQCQRVFYSPSMTMACYLERFNRAIPVTSTATLG